MTIGEPEAKPDSLRPLFIMATIVLVAWTLTLLFLPKLSGSMATAGQTGDMFGIVNALFSGLTLSGLVMTILMQRRQVVLQSDELSLTRREFSLQRFEGTLFGLIRQLSDHILTINTSRADFSGIPEGGIGSSSRKLTGHNAIREVAGSLPDQIFSKNGAYDAKAGKYEILEMNRTIEEQMTEYRTLFDQRMEEDFAPYMRILYGIFRHIDLSTLSEDRKKMYSRIARAGLSSAELKVVFFDCASEVGRDFVPWIEKYGLLKHLPISVRDANPNLVSKYSPSAFEPKPIPHTQM